MIHVVSFGVEREIWWKEKEFKGLVPQENRQLLKSGSIFIMPAGFQANHFHKIPKADREVGPRVSLTFRNYKKMKKLLLILSLLFLTSCDHVKETVEASDGHVIIDGKNCTIFKVNGVSLYPIYYIDCKNGDTTTSTVYGGKNKTNISTTIHMPEAASSCK